MSQIKPFTKGEVGGDFCAILCKPSQNAVSACAEAGTQSITFTAKERKRKRKKTNAVDQTLRFV